MKSIAELIKLPEQLLSEKRPLRERSMLLNDIYELYSSLQDKKLRHIYNIENYKKWLRNKRIKHSPTNWELFRKSSNYVKTIDIGSFAIRLAHLKKPEDLYFLLSVAKDKYRRGEPVGAYIFYSTKKQK